MNVAICDDDKVFREELKKQMRTYQQRKRIAVEIEEYETGSQLLQSKNHFDMVFMDYQMSELDGLSTAKEIRSRNDLCQIIFITGYPSFVFQSFEVQPFRFFLKPLDSQELFAAMDSYLHQQKLLNPIMIVEGGERKIVRTEEIVYLEADRKHTLIRTRKVTYRCAKTLSAVDKLLPMHCFFRVHKSYSVNMYRIVSATDSVITLTDGEKLPISRLRAAAFRKAYQTFVKNYYVRW